MVLFLLDAKGGDLWIANTFYELQGSKWLLRDYWLTEQVLHKGARVINYLAVLSVVILAIASWRKHGRQSHLSNAVLALLLSLLTSFALIALLKSLTNKACPWDLQLFGGSEPYYHLFQSRPSSLATSKCFPAGHASVGYAWIALFYFYRSVKSQWRWYGFCIGLFAGFILGLNQQLRGAHFMSHDVTTLLLCWLVAAGWFRLICQSNNQKKSISTYASSKA